MTSISSHDQIAESGRPVLAIASSNQGKIAEFRSLFGNEVDIMSLPDLGFTSPAETESTFDDNALLKARYVYEQGGMVTLADDSGLEVDALVGAPGVWSARYAGEQHNDADNRALLLQTLSALPNRPRTARFVAAIAIIDTRGSVSLFRGTCEGSIAFEERGSSGFGYDSLFELPDGRTMAELSNEEKNAVSHRAFAVRHAIPTLRAALGLPASAAHTVTP